MLLFVFSCMLWVIALLLIQIVYQCDLDVYSPENISSIKCWTEDALDRMGLGLIAITAAPMDFAVLH